MTVGYKIFLNKNLFNKKLPHLTDGIRRYVYSLLNIFAFVVLSHCTQGGDDFKSLNPSNSNGLDSEGIGRCSILELAPLNDTQVKVSGSPTGSTLFSITPQGTNCVAKYYLNGSATAYSEGTSSILNSSDLVTGENRLRVELTGPIGSDFKEWTIIKNVIPSCQMLIPAVPNINATEGSTPSFTVNATVETGETPTFTWLLNGSTSNRLTRIIEGGGASQYQLNTTGLSGIVELKSQVSDGIDTASCTYQVNIGPDCSLTGKDPNITSLKLANAGASQAFSVTSPTSSCLVSWTINGIPITGSGLSRGVNSNELNVGSNLLRATVVSTSGTSEQSWVVQRNAAPTCSLSPLGTVQLSSGSSVALQGLFSDIDSDPLSWSWKLNGADTTPPLLTIVNGVNQSTGTFAPTDSNLGFNTVSVLLNDGYDSVNCNWSVQVNPACSISSKSPDTNSLTIANLGTTQNIFAVSPSTGSCSVAWELNGVNLGSSLTLQTLMSSSFLGTPNTLRATVSNASSSQSHTWTINKNKLPVCATQTPATSGYVMGVGSSNNFYLAITDEDVSQSHTFNWKLNGSTPHVSYFSSVTNSTNTTGTWIPLSGQAGSHNLTVDVFDGFDTRSCSWSSTVLPNCAVSSSSPAGATLKVAFEPTTSTSFAAVANDGSCSVSWSLNGTPVGTGSFYDATSSSLNSTNTLTATLSNAVSSTSRNWTVNKNTLSTCSSQTPAAVGSQVDLGDFLNFTGVAGNPDSDVLSFSWLLNGLTTASFDSIVSTAGQSSSRFTPNTSQIGINQLVRLRIWDGYDASQCDWTIDVRDPNQAQILSWTPLSNPVVIVSDGSVDLSVVATGTGITYSWFINDVIQPGRTASTETFTNAQLAVGLHNIKVRVTDTYSNTAEKVFSVKRNARPVISTFSPNESGVTNYKVNLNRTLGFTVNATDANGDSLNYTWTLNNSTSVKLIPQGGGTSASFEPNSDTLMIGSHVVRVTISDGNESATQAWTVHVNYFSDACNTLFNSSSTGTNGGKACTLVGNPSIGDDEEVLYDPTLFKGVPNYIIELEPNVYAFTDNTNHTVGVVNASGTNKTYFGKSIGPNKMRVVLGMGQRGLNTDLSAFVDAFNPTTGQPNVKLWQPLYLAYDSVTGVLYISENQNHRVVALNTSGRAIRVLGQSAAGTATTSATAQGNGQSVSCANAQGLAIQQEGANKFLYVACSGQHSIKKVNITNFTGSNSDDFVTSVAIGRFTNVANVYSSGYNSGLAGPTNTPATGSVARVTSPSSLFAHDGLLYFTDSFRIQVYNPTNDLREIYPDYLSQPERFTSNTTTDNFYFQSVSLENTWTTHGVQKSKISLFNTEAPASYTVVVATNGRTVGGCHLGIIEARNGGGSQIKVNANTNVTVTANAAILHNTPDCSDGVLASRSITIPAGRSLGYFWYKPDSTAARTLSAPAAATLTATAVTAGTPVHASLRTTSDFDVADCVALEIRLSATNANNTSQSLASPIHISPLTNNFGTFYSDATCSTLLPDNRVTFSSGSIGIKTVFFNRRTLVAPNSIAPIFGYISAAPFGTSGLGTYSIYTTSLDGASVTSSGAGYYSNAGSRVITPYGNQTYGGFDYPEGIAFGVNTGAGGSHGVAFLNLKPTDLSLGRTVHNYSVRALAGPNATNFNAGYNGDDQAAIGASYNDVFGVYIPSSQDKIIISDRGNNRARYVELNGSAFVRPFLGIGRQRERANALQIQASEASLARPFKLELFDNKLYFSELNNHRIRRVDLVTGITEVVAGAGNGNSFNEGNDATAEFMRNPKGFKVVAWPNNLSPTNYILVYAESCQVRAVNIAGPTIGSFMGVNNILPGKVKTIAGDTSVNCQGSTMWAGYNSNGMNALAARFRNVYDIAFIKNEIYFIDYNETCMFRIDSTGKLYEVTAGTCNVTGASVEGEFGAGFQTRLPIGFAPDSAFIGSYFLLDSYGSNTARLNYINASTIDRSFVGGAKVGYATSNIARASLIYDINGPAGLQARPGGAASWSQSPGSVSANDRICWSSGDVDTTATNQVHGTHTVNCALRASADTGSVAAGPLTGGGAGGPLGFEQEGASRFNISFWGPTGIAFDDEGNLYIADSGNHIIRMIRRWW